MIYREREGKLIEQLEAETGGRAWGWNIFGARILSCVIEDERGNLVEYRFTQAF